MPLLSVLGKDGEALEHSFSHFVTIGADSSNDLILREGGVSDFHAVIYHDSGSAFQLCDLSGGRGVKVRGEPVTFIELSIGSTFSIKDYYEINLLEGDSTPDLRPRLSLRDQPVSGQNVVYDPDDLETMVGAAMQMPETAAKRLNRLLHLLALSSRIMMVLDYEHLLEAVLSASMEAMEAERGFLVLRNDSGEPKVEVRKGFDPNAREIEVSRTIIKIALENGRSVLTANALSESTFRSAKSVLSYRLKSIMCVPLKVRSKVLGCLYLDNPNKAGSFAQDDLAFFTTLSNQMAIAIENARLHTQVLHERRSLQERLEKSEQIVVKSPKMVDLYSKAERVGKSVTPVLILGETGTGKEFVARAIHRFSARKGEFIAINCSAIPETLLESELFGYERGAFAGATAPKAGWIERAKDGTVFLDEVGDMALGSQAKLLRVIQYKELTRLGGTRVINVDVRVVSATNKDLGTLMQTKGFRDDLYYRLAGVVLTTFPLRERKEEIPVLVHHFLTKFALENRQPPATVSKAAMQRLQNYVWPGNINELKNVVIAAALLGNGKIIDVRDLPEALQKGEGATLHFDSLEDLEREHIKKALTMANGNKTRAAALLKVARDTLYRKLKEYGIE